MKARFWPGPALALLLAIVPTSALASCESIISVQSRALDIGLGSVLPPRGEPMGDLEWHRHFRALAHGLAIAQCCLEAPYDSGSGAARSILYFRLGEGGNSEGLDTSATAHAEPRARRRIANCSRADWDSSCVLWTCELGRYSTAREPKKAFASVSWGMVSDARVRSAGLAVDAHWTYVCCGGNWEPGPFLVPLNGGRFAARFGLHFTEADAERARRGLPTASRSGAHVLRQRVDGPLLEQALREPPDSDK